MKMITPVVWVRYGRRRPRSPHIALGSDKHCGKVTLDNRQQKIRGRIQRSDRHRRKEDILR
jgi:hypothetical protein